MNLFALELSTLLEQRRLSLAMLHTLRAPDGGPLVSPAKVARLQRALSDNSTAVLSEAELEGLAAALGLAPAELRRLRAALLGEAVRRLLAGRVSAIGALEEGERVVGLIVAEEEQAESLRRELGAAQSATGLLENRPSADTNAAVAHALEMAAESCELGELWLGIAQRCPDRDQQEDLLGMAYSALDRAAQCLALAPRIAQGSAVKDEWRRTVEGALATVRQLRPVP